MIFFFLSIMISSLLFWTEYSKERSDVSADVHTGEMERDIHQAETTQTSSKVQEHWEWEKEQKNLQEERNILKDNRILLLSHLE